MTSPFYSIITPYHFSDSAGEDYARLLRSLRASLREVRGRGRLILVANGIAADAAPPEKVIEDLAPSPRDRIEPVALSANTRNVGGLNAGIAMAMKLPAEEEDEWIGQVQSSVVVRLGWIDSLARRTTADSHAAFGRIFVEAEEDTIWADGHELRAGLTTNVNYEKPAAKADLPAPHAFPCLSAALFRRSLVDRIVGLYGDFVCERLLHYGDCTDVALRAASVAPPEFVHCETAAASKRRPRRDRASEGCSQLLAASLYYRGRRSTADERVTGKMKRDFVGIARRADAILGERYCPSGHPAPRATSSIDQEWGESEV